MKFTQKIYGLALLALAATASSLVAQLPTIPPSIMGVTPPGVHQGSTVTLALEGRSLAGLRAVLFDSPGLSAKVLGIRDLQEAARVVRPGVDTGAAVVNGPKQEAKLELTVAQDVEPGLHRFRVGTPLGTSNLAVLDVGKLPEVPEVEPNDAEGQPVELPATLVGKVGWPGDVDTYQFNGLAGQEIVFEPVASAIGSPLQSVLVLRNSTGRELARAGDFSRRPDAVLTAKLPVDGKYTISISDFERRGGESFFYRLNAGALPYVTEVFPLGLRAGQSAEVEVKGSNLGGGRKTTVQAPPPAEAWKTVPLRVQIPEGEPVNKFELAVGQEPEIVENEPNNSPAEAQHVALPTTINGHIWSGKKNGPADEDYFRFAAKKGERWIIEVAAARLGSPLDSVVEVLDAEGHEIPQATVRSLMETSLTLSDHDSKTPRLRLTSLSGFEVNNYLMVGDEVVQLIFIPDQPDEDVALKSYGGERIALFNTSPQAHAVNSPVYKVQVAEPGQQFPPNGLPLVRLTYRNDDGGPGYGPDSRLQFIAPKDGDFLLHLKDVRGLEGEDFAYRLTIHEPRPDFELSAQPSNPNLPRGGRVPVEVTANRLLGYNGRIEIEVKGLPKGATASPATIAAGQDSTLVVLSASRDAPLDAAPAAFQIVGRAEIDGRQIIRVANSDVPLQLASVIPPPDIRVTLEPQAVALEPGKEVNVTLHVARENGFLGRVPCNVLNLPPGVRVVNVGLNGVLVHQDQSSQTFALKAEDWASPIEQPVYVVGTVESNSSTEHVSLPLLLKVNPKKALATAASSRATPAPTAER